jgi:hypothetical protein
MSPNYFEKKILAIIYNKASSNMYKKKDKQDRINKNVVHTRRTGLLCKT